MCNLDQSHGNIPTLAVALVVAQQQAKALVLWLSAGGGSSCSMDRVSRRTAAGTVAAVVALGACTARAAFAAPEGAVKSQPALEPEPELQPKPEREEEPAAVGVAEGQGEDAGDDEEESDENPFGSFGLGDDHEEPEIDEAAVARAADAEAINQPSVPQNAQKELWFMRTGPQDAVHVLQEWEHVMERYRQRAAFLYFGEQYEEALAEAEAGLACIASRKKPGAKPHKTGHSGNPTGGGIRKELLDSAARCALALGRGDEATEYTNAILQTWPKLVAKDFGFWLLAGKAQIASKHWAAANDMLCKAVKLRPTNYSGWLAITSMYKAASHAPPPGEEDRWDHTSTDPDGSPRKWKGLRDHSVNMVDGAALKWRLCASATARVRRAFLKYSSRNLKGELVPCDQAEVGCVSLHAVMHSDPTGGTTDEAAVKLAEETDTKPRDLGGALDVVAGVHDPSLNEWEAALVRNCHCCTSSVPGLLGSSTDVLPLCTLPRLSLTMHHLVAIVRLQEGTHLSDNEEADLLSLIEMTDGGDVWLTWWKRYVHFLKLSENNATPLCQLWTIADCLPLCLKMPLRVPRSCGHCARRAEDSEADLIGDVANDEPTLAQKRLG
eukprot:COSAG02_NODE_5746_length_4072_cov_5.959476_1_plen_609_part_00